MEDNRLFGGSNMWIWILLAFLLFSNMNRGGGNFLGGLDCAFPNLFGGCNSNVLTWIIIGIVAYMLLSDDGCSIFRNELQ